MASLTPRGKDQRWLSSHRGITEQPAGSNRDDRKDGITAAQQRLGNWLVGLAWCGTWAANGLLAAGVKGVSFRQASVALIEDDARAGRAPFRDWLPAGSYHRVLRGDLVVLFGRGVHVETVRGFKKVGGVLYVITDGGNTSSGTAGSQSNGGGSYRRLRPLSSVYGFARVDYPGGAVRRGLDRLAMRATAAAASSEVSSDFPADAQSSDHLLLRALESEDAPPRTEQMVALRGDLRKAKP
jgi:hypothetical protein